MFIEVSFLPVPPHLFPLATLHYLFIIGSWNAKVGSQESPRVTGKFGLGVQNEAGQRLIVLPKNYLLIANTLFQQHKRRLYT